MNRYEVDSEKAYKLVAITDRADRDKVFTKSIYEEIEEVNATCLYEQILKICD